MTFLGRTERRPQKGLNHGFRISPFRFGFSYSSSSRTRRLRLILITLAFLALLPPFFFHFRLRRIHKIQLKRCGWLHNPPLVCAHGGDSTNAFPNTMDFCLPFMIVRDLQRISGNTTYRVGHLTMKEIKELDLAHQPQVGSQKISTIEDALKLVSGSVRVVILDVKVGPPSYEKGLAQDILAAVKKMQCENCIIWTKSDSLARDIIKLSSDITVGYIVMVDPSSGSRTSLLRMKGAGVVGVYHPLIDENLTRFLHRRNKKVYAWTVDDADSMARMLHEHVDAVVTSNPIMLQHVMQNLRTECLEEGYSLAR